MSRLERLTNNLLIDNVNLKPSDENGRLKEAYYFREYPKSWQFQKFVVKNQAEYIIDEIKKTKELFLEFYGEDQ